MKIKLKASESLNDWFTIVRAVHDGKQWWMKLEEISFQLMSDERLSPEADIEGSASQMIDIAYAIKKQTSVAFDRCAVCCKNEGVYFHSPKNSRYTSLVSIEDAEELANQILIQLI